VRGDVPSRATGGAKLVKGTSGSGLTEDRSTCSGPDSGPDPAMEGNGSVAVSSNPAAGRETADDERFTETTDPNGLPLAGEAGSKVSEKPTEGHN